MGMAVKGVLAFLWLVLVPAGVGGCFTRKKTDYTLGESFLMGYVLLFAMSEVLILPLLFAGAALHVLTAAYGILSGAAAVWGGICLFKERTRIVSGAGKGIKKATPYLWAAVLLIGIQVYVAVRYAHMDADDSFYVGAASAAVYSDTIFTINPYTGMPYPSIPSRYVLSPFPVFLAVVSQLCGGLHPAITAHTVFPAVFFPFIYLVYHQFGKKWFKEEKNAQGIFLVFAALLCWFSAYSIYNAGNFQMVRIWQGKALLAAGFLPLLAYLCLGILMEEKPEYPWPVLCLANLACSLLSSMGVILAPLVTGCFLILSLIRFRDGKRLCRGIVCCVPSIILGLAYLLIK